TSLHARRHALPARAEVGDDVVPPEQPILVVPEDPHPAVGPELYRRDTYQPGDLGRGHGLASVPPRPVQPVRRPPAAPPPPAPGPVPPPGGPPLSRPRAAERRSRGRRTHRPNGPGRTR